MEGRGNGINSEKIRRRCGRDKARGKREVGHEGLLYFKSCNLQYSINPMYILKKKMLASN